MTKWTFELSVSEGHTVRHTVLANTVAVAYGVLNLYLEWAEPKLVEAPRRLVEVGL